MGFAQASRIGAQRPSCLLLSRNRQGTTRKPGCITPFCFCSHAWLCAEMPEVSYVISASWMFIQVRRGEGWTGWEGMRLLEAHMLLVLRVWRDELMYDIVGSGLSLRLDTSACSVTSAAFYLWVINCWFCLHTYTWLSALPMQSSESLFTSHAMIFRCLKLKTHETINKKFKVQIKWKPSTHTHGIPWKRVRLGYAAVRR